MILKEGFWPGFLAGGVFSIALMTILMLVFLR